MIDLKSYLNLNIQYSNSRLYYRDDFKDTKNGGEATS